MKGGNLAKLIEPAVQAVGYSLWGIEFIRQGKNTCLRVYIENADSSITVDDCARASHQISGVLDVENPIAGQYNLEVSSPGMDRPLYTLEQFQAYVGETVSVKTKALINGQRHYKGKLENVELSELFMRLDDGQLVSLDIDQIEKSNLVPSFD